MAQVTLVKSSENRDDEGEVAFFMERLERFCPGMKISKTHSYTQACSTAPEPGSLQDKIGRFK